jgi:di/tricarboxylate transporter
VATQAKAPKSSASGSIIALGAGLALALPQIGVLDAAAIKKINFLVIVFSAGALSMANVLSQTHALDALNRLLADHITPLISNPVKGSIFLYWGGVLYHFIFPNNQSLLSTSLPLLLNATQDLPYNPAALALIWQFAGGGTLFAYQSAVLVMGYSYGYFESRDLLKYGCALMVIEGVAIMGLVNLYWPLIGLNWLK